MTVTDVELPAVVHRVAEQIERGFRGLAPAESVAGVIVSSGEIAAGLAALPVLEQLKARHFSRTWGGIVTVEGETRPVRDDRVTVCSSCNVAWPCDDAKILGVA